VVLERYETVVSNRVWCKTCGGHLYTEHPTVGLVYVPVATIDKREFNPGFPIHYQESVHHMIDGLPNKYLKKPLLISFT